MAKKAADAPVLKPMPGRKKGSIKEAAQAALPHGTHEEWATFANKLAVAEGYVGDVTAEGGWKPGTVIDGKWVKTESDDASSAPTPRTRKGGGSERAEPSLSELKKVKALIYSEGETVGAIKGLMDKLAKLAEAAGGMDRLKVIVGFWSEVDGDA